MLSPMEEKEFWKMVKRIGRNLRKVRIDRNKTQEEMSERIGFSYKHFQSVENGERPLSMRTLFRISKRLGIPMEKLVS